MKQSKQRGTYTEGWSLYPVCCLGHHVQGAIAAVAIALGSPGPFAAAIVWTVLFIAYQGLTWLRKRDSAGLDLSDYMVGFGLGLFCAAAYFYYASGGGL